jgi:hypothetical protein
MEGTSGFESAYTLEVFALEEQSYARRRAIRSSRGRDDAIKRPRSQNWSLVDIVAYLGMSFGD